MSPPEEGAPDFFPIWRLVVEKVATLTEIKTSWSIEDVYTACEAIDYMAASEAGAP